MKILFFDLEYASCKNGCKICEFGYVITNEKFEIIERNNLIINPYISNDEWDWWALKHILTRTKKEYEERLTFNKYYPKIKEIIESCDYVLGHSLNNDAKALNDDCKRYNLPSIDFDFYDVNAFNQCENNNCILMAVENWRYVHPLLKILPVDWSYTIPFGLLHSLQPSTVVQQFLRAVERATRR